METSGFNFRAHARVRALSWLAASVVAATVLTAAITPAFADDSISAASPAHGPALAGQTGSPALA